MKSSKPPIVLIIVAVLGVGAIFLMMAPKQPAPSTPLINNPVPAPETSKTRAITAGGETLRVTVADTEAAREKGLGGRDGLAPNEGMLFVFAKDGQYPFWMKDMKFSIDILWLTSEGKVVYIQPSLSPDSFPSSYGPSKDARYVLEVPAGFAQNHNILVGDTVQL